MYEGQCGGCISADTVVDPEVDTVICCLDDAVLVVVVRGIVADVSVDTVVIQRRIL